MLRVARSVSKTFRVGGADGGDNVQAADVRGRRAERERMRVVGSMARGCLVDGERGRGRLVESCENYSWYLRDMSNDRHMVVITAENEKPGLLVVVSSALSPKFLVYMGVRLFYNWQASVRNMIKRCRSKDQMIDTD